MLLKEFCTFRFPTFDFAPIDARCRLKMMVCKPFLFVDARQLSLSQLRFFIITFSSSVTWQGHAALKTVESSQNPKRACVKQKQSAEWRRRVNILSMVLGHKGGKLSFGAAKGDGGIGNTPGHSPSFKHA